jgi:3-dehydroquinate synthase
MKRYFLLVFAMVAIILLLFALVEALDIPLLTDPSESLVRLGGWAAFVGVALLVADVVLPVPSSLVMVAHGALFGVAIGALLSLVGSLGAGLFGFGLGRRGGPLIERLVPPEERARANALLERWGDLAVIATRPVPVLAETVAILAGASPMTWGRMTLATAAGTLPACLLYAVAGATAKSADTAIPVFAIVLAISGVFRFLGRRRPKRAETADGGADRGPAQQ